MRHPKMANHDEDWDIRRAWLDVVGMPSQDPDDRFNLAVMDMTKEYRKKAAEKAAEEAAAAAKAAAAKAETKEAQDK